MVLYTDKKELFECQVTIEGASIENTKASLIIEGKKWNLVFYGDIDSKGNCQIDIDNLNIFKEGETGKIRLEVVAEGSVFIPWSDDFSVKTNKKVTVEIVNKNAAPLAEANKSKVTVNVKVPQKADAKTEVIKEITNTLKQKKVTLNNIQNNKTLFENVIFNAMEKYDMANQESMSWIAENMPIIIKSL